MFYGKDPLPGGLFDQTAALFRWYFSRSLGRNTPRASVFTGSRGEIRCHFDTRKKKRVIQSTFREPLIWVNDEPRLKTKQAALLEGYLGANLALPQL